MKTSLLFLFSVLVAAPFTALGQESSGQNRREDAEQVFALANQARAAAGVPRLEWDPALAQAALAHCRRMAKEGPISHQYSGEPDVAGRASEAGAHFSVIEENVAIGPSAAGLHDEWMHSPGHRQNLLSPQVDHVGIAVIQARGVLYAVQDFSRALESMGDAQVEARIANLIRPSGVAISRDPSTARQACAMESGMPRSGGATPRFIMRWTSGDLDQLPPQLTQKLNTGQYRQAAIGSCSDVSAQGSFSSYRLAVLLY